MRACVAFLLFSCVLFAGFAVEQAAPVRAAEPVAALEIFRLLPATIFENTLEGMDADEKERLLDYGKSEYWILLPDSRDDLELVSLPFGDTRVFLHAYREDGGGTLALIGSRSEDICTLELWRMDQGNFAPVDSPPEPPVADFSPRAIECRRMCRRPSSSALTDRDWKPRPCFGTGRAGRMCRWITKCAMNGTAGSLRNGYGA